MGREYFKQGKRIALNSLRTFNVVKAINSWGTRAPATSKEHQRKHSVKHWTLQYVRIAYTCIFISLIVCLTTGPKPLPNRPLHIVRSRASSFNCEYPLLSLRSSMSFLHFLPRFPVTFIPLFIFPSITRCRRQFLRKMWPIQLAFRFLISCRIFLCSLTLSIGVQTLLNKQNSRFLRGYYKPLSNLNSFL